MSPKMFLGPGVGQRLSNGAHSNGVHPNGAHPNGVHPNGLPLVTPGDSWWLLFKDDANEKKGTNGFKNKD